MANDFLKMHYLAMLKKKMELEKVETQKLEDDVTMEAAVG